MKTTTILLALALVLAYAGCAQAQCCRQSMQLTYTVGRGSCGDAGGRSGIGGICSIVICGDGKRKVGTYCGRRSCNIFGCNCGVLPKFDPLISGIRRTYKYRDTLVANCSSEWSSPAARLTWYINNKTAPQMQLQPQINEVIHNTEGFPLYASKLQLRLHIDDQRFIGKSEMLELRCVADILGVASLRRESWLRTTIMALRDSGVNQRRAENGACASARAATFAAWLLCLTSLLRWHCTLS
ncbi:hypothetical protein AWZ03_004504 [Drosophila navojoa]|uniref:CD80-like immunoglobulin C2-set domain-containing protein n=1 Tax=Drosophila navojoa TaxID=7232 RepID=A0A484BJM2_DRONA|nr:hypothetical protein AWZ03_004504 [Drosophila navojoa]